MFILRIHFSSIKHCPTTFSFSLDYKLSSIIKKTYLASKYSPYDKLIPGLASKAKEANCCVWFKDSAAAPIIAALSPRSEEHTSELQSRFDIVCRLLLDKKN